MSGPPTYGNDAGAVGRVVAARAGATVRRHVPDRDGRLEVLAALGLPRDLAEDPPPPAGVAAGYAALAASVLSVDEGQALEDGVTALPARRRPGRRGGRRHKVPGGAS
ncbi:hypothetical protein [Parafrankia sp. BMG5.11]|uniref:hypothetical protein n=1 Tax=Parafrankia sp. BMG5.11 TaxID=222540 RepID=UPI00103D54A1|nr:hypothetical protein [Parafrankia sp. BMG5.11]TCJ36871.1 hypothetical protein E0504_21580 [Parafrankia sp. BMG5.11]